MKNIELCVVQALWFSLCSSACIPPEEESVGEAESELSVSQWSTPTATANAYRSGQIATLNGSTFMVSSGECGAWSCGDSDEANDLYWSRFTSFAPVARTSGIRIPNQGSARKSSVAAFNGFLYMVHAGVSDESQTWITRFDPATEQWSPNFQVPYIRFVGPPAIVAYNNRLYFIGTTPSFAMWVASMSTAEVFTTATTIPGHTSASRPSAAVYNGVIYVAHRNGQTGDIVTGTFDGAHWTGPTAVPAGTNGATIRGVDPVLATRNNFLHLVHRRPESNYVWWTYFDGCSWPAEITINNLQSTYDPSLTTGGPGLVLTTTSDNTWNGIIESRKIFISTYNQPVPRFPPPPCSVIGF